MIAPFVAFVAAVSQQPVASHLVTETLDQAVRHIFPDPTYKVELGGDLEFTAVAYSFSKPTSPKSDLKNFCSALSLETVFDETKKTIKISKSQFLFRNNRKSEVAKSIAILRDQIKPFIKLDPKQIHLRKMNLQSALTTESIEKERLSLNSQIEAMDILLRTPDLALLLSLINNDGMPRILSEPCSKSNHGSVSADAMPFLNQYLNGNGTDPWDFYRPGDTDPQSLSSIKVNSNGKREVAREIGRTSPIPYLRHEIYTRDIQVGLYLITPDKLACAASMDISAGNFEPGTTSNISAAAAKDPIAPQSLWDSENYTTGSFLDMAAKLKANYVSWINLNRLMVRNASSFASIQQLNIGLSASLNHEWLAVYDANSPMPLASKAWKNLFKLREMLEAKLVRRSDLLAAISKLSDTELTQLEDLGDTFHALPKKYLLLTSGIRLFRAYLACLATRSNNAFSGTISYDQLPKEAKTDFSGFFSSSYVWNNYPHLFHPVNRAKIPLASLQIDYLQDSNVPSHNFVQITFPKNWNPMVNSSPIIFPVLTKNMVP